MNSEHGKSLKRNYASTFFLRFLSPRSSPQDVVSVIWYSHHVTWHPNLARAREFYSLIGHHNLLAAEVICFVFSWDHCKSQGKLETMLTQNLGVQTTSIMVFSEVAHYCISRRNCFEEGKLPGIYQRSKYHIPC